jgi:hypothetical protein
MDYREFVRKHRQSGAAITIAALPCGEKDASAFGLMKIDGEVGGAWMGARGRGVVRGWDGTGSWRGGGGRG